MRESKHSDLLAHADVLMWGLFQFETAVHTTWPLASE